MKSAKKTHLTSQAASRKYKCICKFKPFDPHNAVSPPQPCKTHFAYASVLFLKNSPLRKYIMEHFSSPHQHIVHAELDREGVRDDGGEVCVEIVSWCWFWLLMYNERVSCAKMRNCYRNFLCLRVCNVIKKFDFGNLISTPTQSDVLHAESCKASEWISKCRDKLFTTWASTR